MIRLPIKRPMLLLMVMFIAIALVSPSPAYAAVNEDFESYAPFTFAELLTNPDVTFNGGANWVILSGLSPDPTCNFGGNVLVNTLPPTPLVMDFSAPQNSYNMGYNTNFAANFVVEGYLNGGLVFTDNFTAGPCPTTPTPGGIATGSGIIFDRLIVYTANPFDQGVIDNLVTTDAPVAPPPAGDPELGINVPNKGEIMITSEMSQFGYGSPAGEPARTASGAGVWLPNDIDGNGFDTYVVTGQTEVDGEVWLSIFIGNETWVWVPQSTVIVLR